MIGFVREDARSASECLSRALTSSGIPAKLDVIHAHFIPKTARKPALNTPTKTQSHLHSLEAIISNAEAYLGDIRSKTFRGGNYQNEKKALRQHATAAEYVRFFCRL